MSLELESINGLSVAGEPHAFGGVVRRGGLNLTSGRVESNSVINRHLHVRARGHVNNIVGEEGEPVPVTVLVDVGDGNVLSGTETNKHVLNGPLKLAEENVVGGYGLTVGLESVHANERETDAFNILNTVLFAIYISNSL